MNIFMASEDDIFKRVVQYRGPIDVKALYETMFDRARTLDYSVHEQLQRRIVRGAVTDIHLIWECTRAINAYVMFKIKLKYDFYSTKEVEVVENNQRRKRLTGIFKTTFTPYIVLDWQNNWVSPAWKKKFREWYDRYYYGRKPFKPVRHAFGQYYNWILKLNDHFLLYMNRMREFYGMPLISGIKEV